MVGKVSKKNKARGEKSQLNVQSIAELGGTEDDLKLLADVPDSGSGSEDESAGEDLDAEPIKRDEIRDLLKKLDIFKYRPGVADDSDEEQDGDAAAGADEVATDQQDEHKPSTSVENQVKDEPSETQSTDQPEQDDNLPSTSKRKKKKEKNKYKVQHEEISSTTKDAGVELRTHIKGYQKRKYLLVKAGEYFEDQEADTGSVKLSDDMIKQMEDFAAKLLQDEITVYNKQKENTKRSDVRWMRTVLTSGTLADKIAALTVLIQESPLHNLAHLDTLVNMARKKNRRENTQATDALKELFLTDLMPSNRKLKAFSQRHLSGVGQSTGWNKDVLDKRLVLWYFESQLKLKYSEFVTVIQGMALDTLPSTKQKAIKIIYNLLVEKPEQEKMLLELLINKVGDPNYKLASMAAHLLTKLVARHPNMKEVVVREVEQLLFRPNVADKAQYYSVCFLNQLTLSHLEKDLASKLIHIYFTFFKGFVKKGEVDGKMMSALLTGVNRAFPYAKLEEKVLNEQLDHLYKLVHIVNFSTSIQALMLLYQVMDTSQNISERYYSALYRKLADPGLKTSSKPAVFLNLLFKSMKKDESDRRIKAFVKRLLQICSYQQPTFVCGALILLSEVLKVKPGLLTISHAEEDSDEEEHFVDLTDPSDLDTPITADQSEGKSEDTPPLSSQSQSRSGTSAASWVHRANLNHKSDEVCYDPFHRNPQYCHAENECIWELEKLAVHFHPSVSLFAKQILKGQHIKYSGDPLQDFSLIRFLERFVYKNPKKREQIEEKVSAISRKESLPRGVKTIAVTSDRFLHMDETKIPVDDVFLHRYFQRKAVMDAKKVKADDDSDAESVTDAEFDKFLDKFEGGLEAGDVLGHDVDFSSEFGKKRGELGVDSDDDSDLDADLSDEEIDLDDDELAQAFKSEMADLSDDDDLDEDGDFAYADAYQDQFADDDDDEGDVAMGDDDYGGGGDDDGGFDEEDVQFSDEDDEFGDFMPKGKPQKRKAGPSDAGPSKKKGKKGKGGTEDIISSAEQFANMLDETGSSKVNMAGSDALSNKDKAHAKQLKWEMDRDRWLKGDNKRHFNKGKGHKFSKGGNKQFSKGGNKQFSKGGNKQGPQKNFRGKKGRRK